VFFLSFLLSTSFWWNKVIYILELQLTRMVTRSVCPRSFIKGSFFLVWCPCTIAVINECRYMVIVHPLSRRLSAGRASAVIAIIWVGSRGHLGRVGVHCRAEPGARRCLHVALWRRLDTRRLLHRLAQRPSRPRVRACVPSISVLHNNDDNNNNSNQ